VSAEIPHLFFSSGFLFYFILEAYKFSTKTILQNTTKEQEFD